MAISATQRGPQTVVATAIEMERARLRDAFRLVYRPDGTVNTEALYRFAKALYGTEEGRQ